MIGSFTFNDISSDTYSLVCRSVKRPLLPAMKVKRVDLPGSSGSYDFEDNEYDLRTVTMRITYIGVDYEELRTRARSIAAWLSTTTWKKLIITGESDKFYLARVTEETDLSTLWEAGEAEVSFDCQPFAYSVNESNESFDVVALTNHVFSNSGTRVINYRSPYGSKFLITVTGSWSTLSLTLNGATLSYASAVVDGTLILDNIEMEATLDGENAFGDISGDIDTFLSIIAGSNTLTVDGTDLDISVDIDFIQMWI